MNETNDIIHKTRDDVIRRICVNMYWLLATPVHVHVQCVVTYCDTAVVLMYQLIKAVLG